MISGILIYGFFALQIRFLDSFNCIEIFFSRDLVTRQSLLCQSNAQSWW